jgi:hypothetical protein
MVLQWRWRGGCEDEGMNVGSRLGVRFGLVLGKVMFGNVIAVDGLKEFGNGRAWVGGIESRGG